MWSCDLGFGPLQRTQKGLDIETKEKPIMREIQKVQFVVVVVVVFIGGGGGG
jgi:hypothetical protein